MKWPTRFVNDWVQFLNSEQLKKSNRTNYPEILCIHFYTDDPSALTAITDPLPKPAQEYAYILHMEATNTLNNQTIEVARAPKRLDTPEHTQAKTLAEAMTCLASPMPSSQSNVVFKSPVHWTGKDQQTGPNWTGKELTVVWFFCILDWKKLQKDWSNQTS